MSVSNSCLRELTPDEMELVAGGHDTITVTGYYDPWDWVDRWWYEQMFEDQYYDYGGGGGEPSEPPPPADTDSRDVTVNITRPLTAAEQAAVDKLNVEIGKVNAVINAIPDNATITLTDGSTVTGAELKAIWAATDFVINEVGTLYQNGTTRGEANYNNGDPVVSYNVNILQGYNQVPGGIDYAILHEIGHMTANSRAHNAIIHADNSLSPTEEQDHERMANDIARAIATYGAGQGLTVMADPGFGYSSTVPSFTTPSSGSSGGGGYAYYTYDLPFHYAGYYRNLLIQ